MREAGLGRILIGRDRAMSNTNQSGYFDAAAEVQKNFGQGRVYSAQEMLARGMIDRIATFDETLARMVRARPATTTASVAADQAVVAKIRLSGMTLHAEVDNGTTMTTVPLMMSLVEPEPLVEPIEVAVEGQMQGPVVDDTEAILAALVTDEV